MIGNETNARRRKYFHPAVLFVAFAPFALGGCGDAEGSGGAEGETAAELASNGESNGAFNGAEADAPEELLAIPAGTRLEFEVTQSVSTETHRRGDTFTLRLVEPVSGTGGLTVEAGQPARALITAADASPGPDDEAVLAFQVQTLEVEGRNRALNGAVESADTETATRDSGTRSAAKVATGAAAGAIVGQILGRDTRSTVQGAAAGAAAGLGVALTTADGHAVLPEGSRVVVRLEDALVVE